MAPARAAWPPAGRLHVPLPGQLPFSLPTPSILHLPLPGTALAPQPGRRSVSLVQGRCSHGGQSRSTARCPTPPSLVPSEDMGSCSCPLGRCREAEGRSRVQWLDGAGRLHGPLGHLALAPGGLGLTSWPLWLLFSVAAGPMNRILEAAPCGQPRKVALIPVSVHPRAHEDQPAPGGGVGRPFVAGAPVVCRGVPWVHQQCLHTAQMRLLQLAGPRALPGHDVWPRRARVQAGIFLVGEDWRKSKQDDRLWCPLATSDS